MKRFTKTLLFTSIILLSTTTHAWFYDGWTTEAISSPCVVAKKQISTNSADISYWVCVSSGTSTQHTLYARVNNHAARIVRQFTAPSSYPATTSHNEIANHSLSVFSDGSYYVAWAEDSRNAVAGTGSIRVYYKYYGSDNEQQIPVIDENATEDEKNAAELAEGTEFLPTAVSCSTQIGIDNMESNYSLDDADDVINIRGDLSNNYCEGIFFGSIKFYDPNHYSIGYTKAEKFIPSEANANFWNGDGIFYFRQVLMMKVGNDSNGEILRFRPTQTWTENRGDAEHIETLGMPDPPIPTWKYSTNGDGLHDAMAYGISPYDSYEYTNYPPGTMYVMTTNGISTLVGTGAIVSHGTSSISTSSFQLVTTDDNKIHFFYPYKYKIDQYNYRHILRDQKVNYDGTTDGSPISFDYHKSSQTDRLLSVVAKPGTAYYDLLLVHKAEDDDDTHHTYILRYRGSGISVGLADLELGGPIDLFGTNFSGEQNTAVFYFSPGYIIAR